MHDTVSFVLFEFNLLLTLLNASCLEYCFVCQFRSIQEDLWHTVVEYEATEVAAPKVGNNCAKPVGNNYVFTITFPDEFLLEFVIKASLFLQVSIIKMVS